MRPRGGKIYLIGDSVTDFIIALLVRGAWLPVIAVGFPLIVLEVLMHLALFPIWVPLHFILRRRGRKGFIWRYKEGPPRFFLLVPARAFEREE